MLIVLGVTLATISMGIAETEAETTSKCNGRVDFSITYQDGQITSINVDVDGISGSVNDKETVTPNPDALQRFRFTEEETFAGENGIDVDIEGHRVLLVPGGISGVSVVHLFNYTTEGKVWNTVNVYCQPLGLAYRRERDQIVGFCRVNTTYYQSITCVPYFRLGVQNGVWVDVSRPGSCSQPLSTSNITNPVILQADTDDEADAVRLYFGERGTNRLHEVSLSAGEAGTYNVDSMTLKIDHLVKSDNTSLRVVCRRVENSSSFYHKSFHWQTDFRQQQETGFVSGFVQTESRAFDSYNLDYLVTFNANRNTVIIKGDGDEPNPLQLSHPLDDPTQCQNLVGPVTHYLICLANNGHLPLLFNITGNAITNQTISTDESNRITKIGILAENIFYLLKDRQELSIYLIDATIMRVGTYAAVRTNTDFIVTAFSSDVNCTITEDVDSSANEPHSNSDPPTAAIVVPIVVITIVIGIVVIVVVVFVIVRKHKKEKKKDTYNKVKEPENEHQEDSDSNQCDNTAIPEDSYEYDSSIPVDTVTQPTPESRYTGERNVEDPPTDSVDAHQEVGDNQGGVMVPTFRDFPNLAADPTRRVESERSNDETLHMEPKSEDCIVAQPCAEDILPQIREDPIGDDMQ